MSSSKTKSDFKENRVLKVQLPPPDVLEFSCSKKMRIPALNAPLGADLLQEAS